MIRIRIKIMQILVTYFSSKFPHFLNEKTNLCRQLHRFLITTFYQRQVRYGANAVYSAGLKSTGKGLQVPTNAAEQPHFSRFYLTQQNVFSVEATRSEKSTKIPTADFEWGLQLEQDWLGEEELSRLEAEAADLVLCQLDILPGSGASHCIVL